MPAAMRIAALALAALLARPACAAPSLVVLVRHAERDGAMADDPPLTAAGRERAQELARLVDVLSSAIPLKAIFATEFRRTQQTAAPTSEHSRIRVTVVPAAAQRDLVRKVLAVPSGTVLIVGQRDTLPELIQALGGPAGIVIGDAEFNHFYALAAPGTPRAKLASTLYGK